MDIGGFIAGQRSISYESRLGTAAAINSETRRDSIEDLQGRISRLDVVVGAIWELLEEAGFKSDELWARIESLSERVDSPVTASPHCRKCDAVIDRGRDNCQFCGEPAPDEHRGL